MKLKRKSPLMMIVLASLIMLIVSCDLFSGIGGSDDDENNNNDDPIVLSPHLKETTAYSFTSNFDWGTAYDSIQRLPILGGTSAVDYEESEIQIQPASVSSEYELYLVESKEDLYRSMNMTKTLEYNLGPIQYNSKVSFAKEIQVQEENIYFMIKAVINGKTFTLSDERLKEAVLSGSTTPESFYLNYGDKYLYKIDTAAEVYVVLSIQCKSVSEKQQIKKDIGFDDGILADFDKTKQEKLESEEYSKRTSLKVYTSGAVTQTIDNTSVSALIDSVNNFIENQPALSDEGWQSSASTAYFKSYADLEGYEDVFINVSTYRETYYSVLDYYDNVKQFLDFFDSHSEIDSSLSSFLADIFTLKGEYNALGQVITDTAGDYFAVSLPEDLVYSNNNMDNIHFPDYELTERSSGSSTEGPYPYNLIFDNDNYYEITYSVKGYVESGGSFYYPEQIGDYVLLGEKYADFPAVEQTKSELGTVTNKQVSTIPISYKTNIPVTLDLYVLSNNKLGFYDTFGLAHTCSYTLDGTTPVPDTEEIAEIIHNTADLTITNE